MHLPYRLIASTALLSLGLTACATQTKKLDAVETQAVIDGSTGGLIVSLGRIRGVRCNSVGTLTFKNLDTDEMVTAKFAFNFAVKNGTNVISASPGPYVPVSGQCTEVSESRTHRSTRNHTFKIMTLPSQSPARVELGKVTNPGSYNFSGGRYRLGFSYGDDVDKLTAKIQKQYPALTIIHNAKAPLGHNTP